MYFIGSNDDHSSMASKSGVSVDNFSEVKDEEEQMVTINWRTLRRHHWIMEILQNMLNFMKATARALSTSSGFGYAWGKVQCIYEPHDRGVDGIIDISTGGGVSDHNNNFNNIYIDTWVFDHMESKIDAADYKFQFNMKNETEDGTRLLDYCS